MELNEEGLTFHPSLEMGSDFGLLALIEGLINDIYNVARLIPRLAKGKMNYKVSPGLVPPCPLPHVSPSCFVAQNCLHIRQTLVRDALAAVVPNVLKSTEDHKPLALLPFGICPASGGLSVPACLAFSPNRVPGVGQALLPDGFLCPVRHLNLGFSPHSGL